MREPLYRPLVLVAALCIDACCGEPANRFHPVAWMGTAIAALKARAPKSGAGAQFAYGAALTCGGCLTMWAIGKSLLFRLGWTPARFLVEAILLKMTFSIRGLVDAAEQVRQPLAAGRLEEARHQLGWHLVSRDTSQLSPSQVAAAAIESVAENASDGVIAPLLTYALGGLPLALAYRFLNTADSMLGYRDARHEWLGKAPARLDDLANVLPSRFTAGLIVLSAPWCGASAANAQRIWRRDSRQTASPNAGHPMSAMAGALGVELEKVDHYQLGKGQRSPTVDDLQCSVRLFQVAMWIGAGILACAAYLLTAVRQTRRAMPSSTSHLTRCGAPASKSLGKQG